MYFKPLHDNIVIQPDPKKDRTDAGILLPETAQSKPLEGTVMAVGPGRLLESGARSEPQVGPGQRVLYTKYGGHEAKRGGHDYLIISEQSVLAILDEAAP